MSFIYNLDHATATEEVASISHMGQFCIPDNFVNTGFTNAVSYDDEDENDEAAIVAQKIVITNEFNNLCFGVEERTSVGKHEWEESRSAVMIEALLYRTYSELDLLQLKAINEALQARAKLPDIDPATILSTFEGHTIFSIYYEDVRVYEQIYHQLTETEFEEEENA